MNSLTQSKNYRELRIAFGENGFDSFDNQLCKLLDLSQAYVSRITTGKRNFSKFEMDRILEHIEEPKTLYNYFRFFPPLGLEYESENSTHDLIDEIQKKLNEVQKMLNEVKRNA